MGAEFTTPLLNETTTYYVSIGGDGYCESVNNENGRKPVTVTVNAPSTGDILTPDPLCVNSKMKMTGGIEGGTWRSLNPDIVKILDTANDTIQALNAGVATLVYTVTEGSCINATTVQVTVLPNSNSSQILIVSTSPICAGEEITINVSADDVINPIFKWYLSEDAPDSFLTGDSYTITCSENTTFYITVSGDNYWAAKK
jgi:hypothetical protein